MTSTTTDGHLSTVAESSGEDYSPPVRMLIDKEGILRYVPVSFERKLVKYDITMSREVYPDGSKGKSWFVIAIDYSKNIIRSRFEILDL